MASSSYRWVHGISFDGRSLPVKEYFTGHLPSDFPVIIQNTQRYYDTLSGNNSEGYSGILITDGYNHTCRETLLGSSYEAADRGSGTHFTRRIIATKIGLLYCLEDERPISNRNIEIISKFCNIFKDDESEFRVIDGNQVLFLCNGYSQYHTVMASLFFYTMRRIGLMEKLIEGIEKPDSVEIPPRILCKYLIDIFLNSSEYCNESNPALVLAYYCYTIYTGSCGNFGKGAVYGPVSSIDIGPSAKIMHNFIKNHVLSLEPSVISTLVSQAKHRQGFKDAFLLMLDLVKR